jgi:hypothetical protein
VIIRDDDDGSITPRRPVVAEAALDQGERLRVPYAVPTARNQNGRPVPVTCTPEPGSPFAQGETDASCQSTAHAERNFTVTVQAPSSPGIVSRPNGQQPVACAVPGAAVRVRTGRFTPGSRVTVGLVAADGSVRALARPTAGAGGAIDSRVVLPTTSTRGPRQLVATGLSGAVNRVRSFDLRLANTC